MLRCQDCGTETPEELAFCLKCRRRAHPRSRYDLTLDDYAYPPDRDAIEMIKATGVLPYLVKHLGPRELTAVLGHELGHVKSGHMLYHTVAEILGGGIGFSASLLGVSIVSVPVRLALLSWHRESEVTADRSSLLVVRDIAVVKSFMTKLAAWSSRGTSSLNPLDIENDKVGMLESVSELFRTHPLYSRRFKLSRGFFESEQFHQASLKIETRLGYLRALIPVCRFCGARKPVEEMFCPSCGKCQT
jgi:hypothetical protein